MFPLIYCSCPKNIFLQLKYKIYVYSQKYFYPHKRLNKKKIYNLAQIGKYLNELILIRGDKNQDRDTDISTPEKLNVLVQGTNFQLKVWEALLKVPFGSLTTYEQIARQTGSPKSMRAVGSAVGRNPIAFLIPCNRVIRKEGKMGEYHWGSNKKKAIVGWEAAKIL